MAKKQVMVRTYPDNYLNPTDSLKVYLNKGYTVLMCNKFTVNKAGQQGNEYILEKEEDE